jgi:SET and MYND domain-containing protein 4
MANEFRAIGNQHYKSHNFHEALQNYNKSLCHARPNSLEFALCFANRSAVYFEIEAYEMCMENVELAINFGYPKDKLETLTDRHERCREILLLLNEAKNNDKDSLLKLSHPSHAKIPFIVDCVDMRSTKNFGRHLITTRELKAGDIIAIERPFQKFIMNDSRYSHCANCLKSEKMNLFPCCQCNYSKLLA